MKTLIKLVLLVLMVVPVYSLYNQDSINLRAIALSQVTNDSFVPCNLDMFESDSFNYYVYTINDLNDFFEYVYNTEDNDYAHKIINQVWQNIKLVNIDQPYYISIYRKED